MMNIQDVFTNFLAIDTITINNIDTIEKFCYDKIRLEPSDPGQSDMSQLELDTLFVDTKTQIEDRLEIIRQEYNFKESVKFKIGPTWINLNQNNNITRPHLHSNSLGIFWELQKSILSIDEKVDQVTIMLLKD